MKKGLSLILMLTALYLSLNAQRIEIIGTDTFASVSIRKLRIANVRSIELKSCTQERDSLVFQIESFQDIESHLRSSIIQLKEANRLNQAILADKQKIIDLCDKERKKTARKAQIFKIERNSAAVACLVLIGKIFIF